MPHEQTDAAVSRILLVGGGVVAMILVALAVAWGFSSWMPSILNRPEKGADTVEVRPSEPQVRRQPMEDLEAHRRKKRAKLHGYQWVDREEGVASIPIERAMELVIREAKKDERRRKQNAIEAPQAQPREERAIRRLQWNWLRSPTAEWRGARSQGDWKGCPKGRAPWSLEALPPVTRPATEGAGKFHCGGRIAGKSQGGRQR